MMNEPTIKIPVFELFVETFSETWEGWHLNDFGYIRRLLCEAFNEHASDKLLNEAFDAPQKGDYVQRANLWREMLKDVLPSKWKCECMIAILILYRKSKTRRKLTEKSIR